ncbi:Pyruvate kinase [Musa troglodytarum]|uniref:Pyruvate kinase n=1 Tax=Musa troglodytarum TaxID=320322 RepID=A0A9E7GYR8_9LILI|nr:Pyruvate kinase [Musa troglodytarum]
MAARLLSQVADAARFNSLCSGGGEAKAEDRKLGQTFKRHSSFDRWRISNRRDLEGVAERRAGAEDEDSAHTGAGIQIGADAGEAAESWHERRQVQLHEYHQETIVNLRIAVQNSGILCAVMLDTRVENQEGVMNFDQIFKETDSFVVARRDLGMEILVEKTFLAQ